MLIVSVATYAGENDLLWDYTEEPPTGSPDNGLYYAGYVNDVTGINLGLKGVKLNTSGYAYFEKAAVAGTLKLTISNRKNTSDFQVNVSKGTLVDSKPSKGDLIAVTSAAQGPQEVTVELDAEITGIYIDRNTLAEGVICRIEFVENSEATVTEIADADALKAFIEAGGNGKLVADINTTTFTTWYMGGDITLDLNDYMVNASGLSVSGFYDDYALTIYDSHTGTPTVRYWQLDEDSHWEYSEAETEYTTEGGVVTFNILCKTFTFKSGNICIKGVHTNNFNISGGNLKFINGCALGTMNNATHEGVMTGGTISYCGAAIVTDKATLLGGTITNNGIFYSTYAAVWATDLTLGGTIRIEGNRGYQTDNVKLDDGSFTLSFSSETPPTEGAHVGIAICDEDDKAIAGILNEGAADYTDYIFSSEANFILKYNTEGQKHRLVAREMTQPTAENPTFDVELTDCTASEASYQWYKKANKTLEKDDCCATYAGSWDDTKLTAISEGGYYGILVTLERAGAVTITFDEVPGTLNSIAGNEFAATSDPKVFTTETVDDDGANLLMILCEKSFTVTLETLSYTAIEGQTTKTLTTTEEGTYACGINIRGHEILSDAIVLSSKTPTAIDAVDAQKVGKTYKTIENGKVVIIKEGERFDITGRKL